MKIISDYETFLRSREPQYLFVKYLSHDKLNLKIIFQWAHGARQLVEDRLVLNASYLKENNCYILEIFYDNV